jgi:AcrR family transcriptional regulator
MALRSGLVKPSGPKRNMESKGLIVDAAISILETQGYTKFSIEKVARTAGVGKQTIYRWWPTKAELILEIFDSYLCPPIPEYDGTTSLQEHLKKYLFIFAQDLSSPACTQAYIGLIAENGVNSDSKDLSSKLVYEPRIKAFLDSLELAISLGEIPPKKDAPYIASMIYGPIFHRIFVANSQVSVDLINAIVDQFFNTLRAS